MPCCNCSSVVWEISWHSTLECQLSHVVAKSDTRIYELYGPAFSSRLVAFIEDLDLPMFMWLAAYIFSYCSCLPWMKIANLREAIPNLIKASSVVHYRYDYSILSPSYALKILEDAWATMTLKKYICRCSTVLSAFVPQRLREMWTFIATCLGSDVLVTSLMHNAGLWFVLEKFN